MKGIVVDKKDRYAVVLTGDGGFTKINNKVHYKVGAEIEFEKPFQMDRSLLARVTSIAAVFMFALGLSYGIYSYTTPYSYVDFDINPSIELTANIYDIIIKVETFNEDGEKLVKSNDLNYKKLNAGIATLVDTAIQEGYLTAQADNAVLLSVDSKNEKKKERLEKSIGNAAANELNERKIESAVISQQIEVQKRDTAKDMGISPGKLTLIEKARKYDLELKPEELKDDSVKEIMKRLKEDRKEEKEADKSIDSDKEEKNGKGKVDSKEVTKDANKNRDIKRENQNKDKIIEDSNKKDDKGGKDSDKKDDKDEKDSDKNNKGNDSDNKKKIVRNKPVSITNRGSKRNLSTYENNKDKKEKISMKKHNTKEEITNKGVTNLKGKSKNQGLNQDLK